MIDVWAELSKVYNMENIPDEAMSIIGDLMLAWSDEQDTISRYAVRSIIEAWCSEKKIVGGLLKMIDELPSQPTHETHSKALKSLDCIDRQSAIDAFKPYAEYESNRSNKDWVKRIEVILSELPSAQPEERTETHACDCVSRKAAIEWCLEGLNNMPSAQPDIIRCNACKHWTQTTGNMPGFGLGDCDYLNAKFVNCNGYCYWAERRQDG